MIRDFAIAHDVFETSKLIRENGREEILRFHPLQRRSQLGSAAETRDCERSGRVPAPTNRKHRRIEQGLNKNIPHRFRIQITKNFLEWKRVLGSERDHDGIVSGRSLELEIEGSTKTFPKRQTPRAIDSITKRRMQNELHSARLIEEPLHHDRLLRRNRAERAISIREIICNLL